VFVLKMRLLQRTATKFYAVMDITVIGYITDTVQIIRTGLLKRLRQTFTRLAALTSTTTTTSATIGMSDEQLCRGSTNFYGLMLGTVGALINKILIIGGTRQTAPQPP